MTASAIMTPLGIAALKAREGVRLTAYCDSVGVPTIGYGHTKGVRLGQRITQGQADALFLEDLARHALPILSSLTVPVAEHERDALISIAFNIGVGAFRRSGFLRRLNAGDRAGAAEAILAWRKPPEIVSRRLAEYDQFRTPYAVAPPRARRGDGRPVAVPKPPDSAHPALPDR
ncbi:lysozyme, partial [Methylobacterium haplocladii]